MLGDVISLIGRTAKSSISGAIGSVLDGSAFRGQNPAQPNPLNVPNVQDPSGDEWVINPDYLITLSTNGRTIQAYAPESLALSIAADYDMPMADFAEGMSSGMMGQIAKAMGVKISANLFSAQLWNGSSHIDTSIEMRFVAVQDSYTDVVEPIRTLYSLITPVIEEFSQTEGAVQLGFIKSPGPSLELNLDAEGGDPTRVLEATAQAFISGVTTIGGSVIENGADIINDPNGASVASGAVNVAGTTVRAVGGFINSALKNIRVKNNISLKIGRFCYLKSIIVKDVSPQYNVKYDNEGCIIDATVSVSIGTFVSPTNVDIPNLIGYQSTARSNLKADATSLEGITDSASDVQSAVDLRPPRSLTLGGFGESIIGKDPAQMIGLTPSDVASFQSLES